MEHDETAPASSFEQGLGELDSGPRYRKPHEVIRDLANEGSPIPLGWAPLDRQLRGGGARAGRIIVLGGPPQSGKTTVLCQITLHLSQTLPVYTLFSDEGDEGAATRIGVQLGVALEKLELQRTLASAELEIAEGERTIYMVEPDRLDSSPDRIVADILKRHPQVLDVGARAVLVLDSIQTIAKRLLGKPGRGDDSPRIPIQRFMDHLRQWAIDHRLLVLATSRSNRASYRHKKTEDNSEGMASFAESSDIEFASDVALAFGLAKDDGAQVEIVKNRLKGTMGPFKHRYDETSGRMLEVDADASISQDEQEGHARVQAARGAIQSALKLNPNGLTSGALYELAGKGLRKTTYFAARQNLIDNREIFSEMVGRSVHFRRTLSDDQ